PVVIPSFRRRNPPVDAEIEVVAVEAARGKFLIEESPEVVLVLGEDDLVLMASRRARDLLPDVAEGRPIPPELLENDGGRVPVVIPYEVGDREERLGDLIHHSGRLAGDGGAPPGFPAAVAPQ